FVILEALFRSRLYSPPRRGGGAAPSDAKAQTGWRAARARQGEASKEDRRTLKSRRFDHPGLRPPLLCEVGIFSLGIFLLSNVMKCFLLSTASLALLAVGFSQFFATPIGEWPQLWPDARAAVFISLVTVAALAFLLTIIDTLVRNDALELLGTDLFRVTGLVSILVSFEAMIVSACAVALAAGFLNVTSWKSALGTLAAGGIAAGLLTLLHSYLLLVRYSTIGIMRQNVIEI